MKKFKYAVVLILLSLLFTGCMQHDFNVKLPQNLKVKKQQDYNLVNINTTYGHKSELTGDIDLESGNFLMSFKNGLFKALDESNIFSIDSVNNINISVKVIKNDAPNFGLSMTVDNEIVYQIVKENGDIIYNNKIVSRGTATPGDRFIGAERVFLANDRSIHNNIKLFIEDISLKLELLRKEKIEESQNWR